MTDDIEISTYRYEWAHRHKPRGYGLWYFELPGGVVFSYLGSFAEARRAAARFARAMRCPGNAPCVVCP